MDRRRSISLSILLLLALGILAYFLLRGGRSAGEERSEERVAVVKVAAVERRALDLERTLSGALEAKSKIIVAPKVGGRILRLEVDLADPVQRGQTVAFLDDAEFAQAVIQAEAELAVRKANLAQASNALEIGRRENQRIVTLRERGIASDSESDLAAANLMEKEAQVKVAEAEVNRATAALEAARIRYEYTRVAADWTEGEGDTERMVAERFVNEGETVSANAPLLLIVQLDPIIAVISVTERDYGQLRPGQEARITTDAFPDAVFLGRINRIAPVFREMSRQARVELTLANPEGRLKPGMFIRATITLDHVDEAVAVPEESLTRRGDVDGVFQVDETGERVRWVPVEPGIRSRGWVQLNRPALSGRVVTLGQHLVDDGAPIQIAANPESTP